MGFNSSILNKGGGIHEWNEGVGNTRFREAIDNNDSIIGQDVDGKDEGVAALKSEGISLLENG